MLSVTSGFKTTIRNNAVYSDGYVIIKDGASFTRTYDSDELNLIEIMNDVFKNDTYIGEIGQCALKLNLLGDNVGLLPLDKELTIEVYLGIKVGASYEYVKYQNFLLLEAKYNETTNFTEILATDKLLLLNQDYTDTNTYPMSLGNYVESVCVACGLELNDKTFLNNAFSITEQPFPDVYNAREIIAKASQLAMSFVVINPTNNKVIFKNFYTKLTTNAFDEELDEDEFYKIKLRDKNLGSNGVNTLVLRISQVEGENNTVVNATNVGIDGNIEVVISDNDFINTEAKRLSIINSMFTRIDTLKYQPLDLEYRGFPYLELGDIIKVIGKNGTYYFPILESMIRYNGGLFGTIKAEPLINTETKYRNTPPIVQRVRNAEIRIDKVTGEVIILAGDYYDGKLEGAKYVFDGTNATFTNGGLIIKNALGETVFTADIDGNLDIIGKITATSGMIGRFDISGNDLVYTSDLFEKDYDRSDLVKLHRIILGLEPQTPYDLAVYDFNNSGTLSITDLVILDDFVSYGTPFPTPRKRIRSVVRIGTNNGALTTQAVAENGSLGPSTTFRGEKITGDLLNVTSVGAKTGSISRLETDTLFVNSTQGSFYETGTWVSDVIGSTTSGVGTYTSRMARYTKIGNIVHFNIFIQWSAHTGTGFLRISLPPFTALTNTGFPVSVAPSNLNFSNELSAMVLANSQLLQLYTYSNGGGLSGLNMDTSATLYISGSYMTT